MPGHHTRLAGLAGVGPDALHPLRVGGARSARPGSRSCAPAVAAVTRRKCTPPIITTSRTYQKTAVVVELSPCRHRCVLPPSLRFLEGLLLLLLAASGLCEAAGKGTRLPPSFLAQVGEQTETFVQVPHSGRVEDCTRRTVTVDQAVAPRRRRERRLGGRDEGGSLTTFTCVAASPAARPRSVSGSQVGRAARVGPNMLDSTRSIAGDGRALLAPFGLRAVIGHHLVITVA